MADKEYAVSIEVSGTAKEIAIAFKVAAGKLEAQGEDGLVSRAKKAGRQFFYGINRAVIEVEEI